MENVAQGSLPEEEAKQEDPKAIKASTQVDIAFPIPIVKILWQGPGMSSLNRQIELEVHRERARDPEGIYRSNTAGTWHSKDTMLNPDRAPCLQTLSQMFAKGANTFASQLGTPKGAAIGWRQQCWAMMYQNGGYATAHNHPNCHVAGVYYVAGVDEEAPDKVMATGAKVRAGELEFVGPHSMAIAHPNLNLCTGYRVKPQAGLMVLFPNWLNHFVHPVDGDTVRIALACNQSIAKFTPPPSPKETK